MAALTLSRVPPLVLVLVAISSKIVPAIAAPNCSDAIATTTSGIPLVFTA